MRFSSDGGPLQMSQVSTDLVAATCMDTGLEQATTRKLGKLLEVGTALLADTVFGGQRSLGNKAVVGGAAHQRQVLFVAVRSPQTLLQGSGIVAGKGKADHP